MKGSHEQNMDMESIYRTYENLVYRFLYARTCDSEWAQELMQETFLRAITSISRYDPANCQYGFVRLPSMCSGRNCVKRSGWNR